MEFVSVLAASGFSTALDVAPIIVVLVLFQVAVLRRKLPNLRGIAAGFLLVLAGLTIFLIGLKEALFPIGETMARQLTSADSIGAEKIADGVHWDDYLLVYAFDFEAKVGGSRRLLEYSIHLIRRPPPSIPHNL